MVLLTMARSRSSMTAEIFRRHGVFFGKTRRMGQPGIGYNENLALKAIGRRLRGDCHDTILGGGDATFRPPDFADAWKAILESEGYQGETWAAKVDAFCHRLFDGLPHVRVGIKRNEDDTVVSCFRVLKRRSEEDWRCIVQAHHRHMDSLDIPMIDTDEVMGGDHRSLKTAFDACGLAYDKAIGDSVARY